MLKLMLIMLLTPKHSGAEKFEEGKNFHLHETHFDIIVEVPPMLTVLGSSKNTPVQMCCVGDHFLGKILPFAIVETLLASVVCASFVVHRQCALAAVICITSLLLCLYLSICAHCCVSLSEKHYQALSASLLHR